MKKKSNLRKLIDKKTKYQQKYNNFSQISWIQKIKLRSKLRKIRKTIDLMISSNARYRDLLPKDIIANEKNILKRFILKILIKIFKIQIKRLYGYKENRENARQALYHIAKNIQYNKVILEKMAKK